MTIWRTLYSWLVILCLLSSLLPTPGAVQAAGPDRAMERFDPANLAPVPAGFHASSNATAVLPPPGIARRRSGLRRSRRMNTHARTQRRPSSPPQLILRRIPCSRPGTTRILRTFHPRESTCHITRCRRRMPCCRRGITSPAWQAARTPPISPFSPAT